MTNAFRLGVAEFKKVEPFKEDKEFDGKEFGRASMNEHDVNWSIGNFLPRRSNTLLHIFGSDKPYPRIMDPNINV
ncbi:hypothetical protein Y032_0032g2477 [Ancylostoma ceylanicum]|uniref:Uncharacterized protein n=1 Tax=Ancylostoma ceylanicum TaxID=53326 RepID=A0A016UPF6_9BILA|nr:hypothetical protein Y032_0032g2477 [Ancylostoma ceylanicum]